MSPELETIHQNPQVKESMALVTQAKLIHVDSLDDRIFAAEAGRRIAVADKWFENFIKPMKEKAAATHRAICDQENSVRVPLKDAKQHLSLEIGRFDARLEAERRAEEARLQAEVELQAAREAKRLADEQAVADAIALEAEGDHKGAEAVLNNPVPVQVYVPPVVLQRQTVKTAGVTSSQRWLYIIENAEIIPREYTVPDAIKIGQVVRAMKDKTNIPGIKVYPEGGARFRS
jgi:hypothetical protein